MTSASVRSWTTVQLHEVCKPKQWQTIKKSEMTDIGYAVYGANGVIGRYHSFNHADPTILIGCRGTCGAVTVSEPFAWVTGNAMALDELDTSVVDVRYLVHALVADGLRDAVTGTSQPQITQTSLKRIHLPLPPLQEQQRIAAMLDAAQALHAKRRQALAKLDELTQAVFYDMFGDPRHPEATTAPLGEVAEIVMGQSPPGHSYNDEGNGIPLLNGPSEFGDEHPLPVQWTTAPTRVSRGGDILFCVRGATAGRLNWADREYCLGRGLAAIRAEPPDQAFLYHVLDAHYPYFQVSGVGSTFINISKSDLHGVPVPTADSGLVHRYAKAHSKLSAVAAALKISSAQIDDLHLSLQQRAFRGEL